MVDLFSKIQGKISFIDENTKYSLLLEETVTAICPDIQIKNRVLDLIRNLETDGENIAYRTDIMRDFLSEPSILPDLKHVCEIFSEIENGKKFANSSSHLKRADMTGLIYPINMLSESLLKLLRLYYVTYNSLKCAKSEGLCKLQEEMHRICGCEGYLRLTEILTELSEIESNELELSFLINLDDFLRVIEIDLISINLAKEIVKTRKTLFGKSKPVKRMFTVPVSMKMIESSNRFVNAAVTRLLRILELAYSALGKQFYKLNEQLFFYEFGIQMRDRIEKMGLPCCLATVCKNGGSVEKMYDLWLALTMYLQDIRPSSLLIPNDINIKDNPIMVISGKNGGGKTVYLRAFGLLQIFSQAGLPLPAAKVEISAAKNIFAYFAAADKGQGRFEDEVCTLSTIFDNAEEGDILLLNEVFQSTAFAEASPAFSTFIDSISMLGVNILAVTHLPNLEENIKSKNAGFFIAGENFKIIKKEKNL